jgi:protein TonB
MLAYPNSARLLAISVLVAVCINLVLFYFIFRLVTPEPTGLPDYETPQPVEFIRLKKDRDQPKPERKEKKPEKPKQEKPPIPLKLVTAKPNKPRIQNAVPPVADVDLPMRISGEPYLGDFDPGPLEAGHELDIAAIPTFRVPPVYPPRAMRNGIEGVVTVEFTITADGGVTNPIIVKSEPAKIFDQAVLRAIKKWKFKPRIVDGQAVARRARQDIRFILQG